MRSEFAPAQLKRINPATYVDVNEFSCGVEFPGHEDTRCKWKTTYFLIPSVKHIQRFSGGGIPPFKVIVDFHFKTFPGILDYNILRTSYWRGLNYFCTNF